METYITRKLLRRID